MVSSGVVTEMRRPAEWCHEKIRDGSDQGPVRGVCRAQWLDVGNRKQDGVHRAQSLAGELAALDGRQPRLLGAGLDPAPHCEHLSISTPAIQ